MILFAYDQFYSTVRLSAEDVGLTYLFVLVRPLGLVAIFLGIIVYAYIGEVPRLSSRHAGNARTTPEAQSNRWRSQLIRRVVAGMAMVAIAQVVRVATSGFGYSLTSRNTQFTVTFETRDDCYLSPTSTA